MEDTLVDDKTAGSVKDVFYTHVHVSQNMKNINFAQHRFGMKSKKQTGGMTSAERSSLVRVITYMNAVGSFLPPYLFSLEKIKVHSL